MKKKYFFIRECLLLIKKEHRFALAFNSWLGALAQLVEQWTENPCVPGSIPGGATPKNKNLLRISLEGFVFLCLNLILD